MKNIKVTSSNCKDVMQTLGEIGDEISNADDANDVITDESESEEARAEAEANIQHCVDNIITLVHEKLMEKESGE